MSIPLITPLTNLPSITDPVNFDTRADNFITSQLPQLASEINAAGAAMDQAVIDAQNASAVAINGTSASSVLLGTGSKTFTTQAGHSWSVGTWLMIASRANPGTHWIVGQITAYATTVLTVAVHSFGGSGSRADWDISLTAKPAETPLATTSANGLMSAADKAKLNGVADGANNYSHPTADGSRHVPATAAGDVNKFLKSGGSAGAAPAWAAASKSDVGLGNVDNTADSTKPVSTAQAAAIATKLSKTGEAFSGGYTGPDPVALTGTTLSPTIAQGHERSYTNSAAFTLNAPSGGGSGTICIVVTNAGSGAGAMTPIGFHKVHGTFSNVAGKKQTLFIEVHGSGHKTLSIRDDS